MLYRKITSKLTLSAALTVILVGAVGMHKAKADPPKARKTETSANGAPAKQTSSQKPVAAKKQPVVPAASIIAWDQFETPVTNLKEKSEAWSNDHALLGEQNIDDLEGLANDAVLATAIKSVYLLAIKQKWTQTQRFQIFPIEHLMQNSGSEAPTTFNPGGLRVGVFALKSGKIQKGVLLTSSFQSINPLELRELYKNGSIAQMIENASPQFEAFASDLVEKFHVSDSRQNEHLPVIGTTDAWVVGCQASLAGRFCVNASLFDANDTDPQVFIDAMGKVDESSTTLRQIRDFNLAWPIDRSFISRGYKPHGAGHYGVDLTAPIGTPVRSVAKGQILHAKEFTGWGKTIVIEHELPSGAKFISLYAHLSKFMKKYKPGDTIERGDPIAKSGKSGSSAGGAEIAPHLHLEIRNLVPGVEPLQKPRTKAQRPLDPLRVLDVFNVLLGGDLYVPVDRKYLN